MTVHLKKALYGCVQSAVLGFKELKTTLRWMIRIKNPYDMCSLTRAIWSGEEGREGGRVKGREGKREGGREGR